MTRGQRLRQQRVGTTLHRWPDVAPTRGLSANMAWLPAWGFWKAQGWLSVKAHPEIQNPAGCVKMEPSVHLPPAAFRSCSCVLGQVGRSSPSWGSFPRGGVCRRQQGHQACGWKSRHVCACVCAKISTCAGVCSWTSSYLPPGTWLWLIRFQGTRGRFLSTNYMPQPYWACFTHFLCDRYRRHYPHFVSKGRRLQDRVVRIWSRAAEPTALETTLTASPGRLGPSISAFVWPVNDRPQPPTGHLQDEVAEEACGPWTDHRWKPSASWAPALASTAFLSGPRALW